MYRKIGVKVKFCKAELWLCRCGEGEIRTPGRLAPTDVFKTSALVHYATSPIHILYQNSTSYSPGGQDQQGV
jgi:hypothetical protein